MISVLIPFHNEADNLPILLGRLVVELNKIGDSYEVIFIDDGSTDRSSERIKDEVDNEKVFLVRHGKRLGKGRGLNTGLKKSSGEVIVFMDADLQDDPEDLSKFVDKIREGYDLVNGYRIKRQDNSVIKFYSRMANRFLNAFLQSPFSDINCGFKAFKRSVVDDIVLYANNFRFLPLAAYYRGYKVTEVQVHNRPRIHGKSKYGIMKLFIGLIDTLNAYFLYQFSEKPLHFFGIIGALFFGVGFLTAVVLTIQRLIFNMLLYRRPALLFAILLIIVGIQIIMTGIIGELIVYLHKKNSRS